MRGAATLLTAMLLNAFALAEQTSNCQGVAVCPEPILNANIKNWMSPGIIIGFLLFALVLLPLFYLVMAFTHYVQTPLVLPEKGIPWGQVEETE